MLPARTCPGLAEEAAAAALIAKWCRSNDRDSRMRSRIDVDVDDELFSSRAPLSRSKICSACNDKK